MEEKRGLAGSRWAPQNGQYRTSFRSSVPRESYVGAWSYAAKSLDFDWDCPACGFSNFGWRKECYKCQQVKDAPVENKHKLASVYGNGAGGAVGLNGGGMGRQEHGEMHGMSLDTEDGIATENSTASGRGALAMSRWAPRNRAASQKYGDKTWTRVIPDHATTLTDQNNISLDLGLPYEVQHYILLLLQRILEEGCFAIASRWLPAQLAAKGWSCSEAVELSAWRDFLPNNLPQNALQRMDGGGVTLEQGLIEAVRIRNKAVHRHLVDNNELRGLCWKGERLMALYGDQIRRERCNRLQGELRLWDEMAKTDRDEARRRLELALVEIGERPVGEMDWAPNEVSLAEVLTSADTTAHHVNGVAGPGPDPAAGGGGHESIDDEMELD